MSKCPRCQQEFIEGPPGLEGSCICGKPFPIPEPPPANPSNEQKAAEQAAERYKSNGGPWRPQREAFLTGAKWGAASRQRECDGWKQLHENNEACIQAQYAELSTLRARCAELEATVAGLEGKLAIAKEALENIGAVNFPEKDIRACGGDGFITDAMIAREALAALRESPAQGEKERNI